MAAVEVFHYAGFTGAAVTVTRQCDWWKGLRGSWRIRSVHSLANQWQYPLFSGPCLIRGITNTYTQHLPTWSMKMDIHTSTYHYREVKIGEMRSEDQVKTNANNGWPGRASERSPALIHFSGLRSDILQICSPPELSCYSQKDRVAPVIHCHLLRP